MELTHAALWLNEFFSDFDGALLGACHSLAESAGTVVTPIAKAITFIGEKGILMLFIAVVLICFRKARPAGVCMFGSVCCGALITNLILKDFVARPRPFNNVVMPYYGYWLSVGSPAEDGFSFPSGHVTAAAAGVTALALVVKNRKVLWAYVYVALMCVSRCYLMAHYPSDVLAALVVGVFSAFTAFAVTKLIFVFSEKHKNNRFFEFVLNFDISEVLCKK